MRLDIGLIGATRIAERAVLRPSAHRADVVVRAVAASDRERAVEFAARNGIARAHADYSALVDDPDINVVYVSLHNSAHHEWAVRAADAGKHVIVEKPLCLDAHEVASIQTAATKSGVKVVEAVPGAGHRWQKVVRALVVDQPYGPLRSVHSRLRFGAPVPGSYRERPELGGGIFLDTASYWLQAVQSTVGLTEVTGQGHSEFEGPLGADRAFRAELRCVGGVDAVLDCRVDEIHAAQHDFVFERATVRLRNFLRPVVAALPLNLVVGHDDGAKEVLSYPAIDYYEQQLDHIHRQFSGQPDRWGGEFGMAAERVELMARTRSDAVRRHFQEVQ